MYEGKAVARPDRSLCSLCGEVLYEPVPVRPLRVAPAAIEGRGRANAAAGPISV